MRQRLLERAELGLKQSWALPTRWHAGAAEALSAVIFLKAETLGDASLFEQSARWATHTVRLAPVQPNAWIRLAALAERGYGNSVCDIDLCLERSWSVALMVEPEPACARLQLAQRRNLLTPNDARIEAYLDGGASRSEAARCLSFLPPDELFQTLMRTLSSD
ncbi:hypothetical protein [Terricaulis silvestris]|uniref:hypothetical protein n=1 Tax=Terricaulis silvestris TaxID=2686094 RepID=UPI001E40F1C0|nr:hypothetical protein [Terricaulis silvestris]